jgi:hypothetical protein
MGEGAECDVALNLAEREAKRSATEVQNGAGCLTTPQLSGPSSVQLAKQCRAAPVILLRLL